MADYHHFQKCKMLYLCNRLSYRDETLQDDAWRISAALCQKLKIGIFKNSRWQMAFVLKILKPPYLCN